MRIVVGRYFMSGWRLGIDYRWSGSIEPSRRESRFRAPTVGERGTGVFSMVR